MSDYTNYQDSEDSSADCGVCFSLLVLCISGTAYDLTSYEIKLCLPKTVSLWFVGVLEMAESTDPLLKR